MKRLAVIGAGGHGRVVADSAATCGWNVHFFDDKRRGSIDGWEVTGKAEEALTASLDGVIVAIGDNRARLKWLDRLRSVQAPITTIIDPSASISRHATIGAGSFVARGGIISAGACLGAGCIVNTAASVDHDCNLADAVHLSPGVHLSGTVRIGECSWLGTGSSVRNNISIGPDVIIGVGGVVVRDVEGGQTVVGVPAQALKRF